MGLNRREVLRFGAIGAAGAMLSSAASSVGLPSIIYAPPPVYVVPQRYYVPPPVLVYRPRPYYRAYYRPYRRW